MPTIVKYLLYLSSLVLLFSCANQTAPQGGPKDEDAPELERSTPEQKEINFKEQKIELYFNEYVNTNQPKQEIIITPTIEQEYEIKYRKNVITLTFEEPLEDSTTYTINFREAIQDITEKNSPSDLKLAFSTGPYLDSMVISGTVKDLLTSAPQQDVTVGLYTLTDTLNLLVQSPTYFTKTDEEGQYKIENIKIGTYRMLAFKDANKNLTPQTKSEAYGYLTSQIELDTILTDIDFDLLNLNLDTLKISRARQVATTFQIKYNKYITNYSIVTFDSVDQVVGNFTDATHETIQIYNTFSIQDSIPIFVHAFDSLASQRIDTLFLKFKETNRKPAEFTSSLSLDRIITNQKVLKATVNFNKPITHINYDSVFIYIDSTTIYPFDSSHFQWNDYHDMLDVTYALPDSIFSTEPEETDTNSTDDQQSSAANEATENTASDSTRTEAKPDQPPHIYFGLASFISAQNDSSAILKQPLTFDKPESLGIIEFQIETEEPCYFLQLIDDKFQVVKELYNPDSQELQNLEPGQYNIRIVVDTNCNKKWDLGSLLTNTYPEPIFIHELPDGLKNIVLRANWVNPIGVIKF
ncbi:MAG: Ig-like domain-containing domain [Bacteroidota bacterium]